TKIDKAKKLKTKIDNYKNVEEITKEVKSSSFVDYEDLIPLKKAIDLLSIKDLKKLSKNLLNLVCVDNKKMLKRSLENNKAFELKNEMINKILKKEFKNERK
ncbi:MAG: hypothetical protein RR478_04550, partial [Bacilli bacterium]